MKSRFRFCLLLSLFALGAQTLFAQGTAFTYQGRLTERGSPANGVYDFVFDLYDAELEGNKVGQSTALNAIQVSDGQFAAAMDPGEGVFIGAPRWLQISIRRNGAIEEPTLLEPRQSLLPSPSAIYAGTASRLANQSLTPDQLDTGGAAPAAGQWLSYDGARFVWSEPPPSAGSIWALNGTDAYFETGNVGIGTRNPTPGVRLEVNGAILATPGGSGGSIQFGTPSAETGMTILGTNRADLRFDGQSMKLVAGPGRGVPSSLSGLAIGTNGNVGIGTTSPLANYKLDVAGHANFALGGSGGGFLTFGTPNAETGITFSGNNRADIRFDGLTLKLVAGSAGGPPSSESGVIIGTAGQVGIGAKALDPNIKLSVRSENGFGIYALGGYEGVHAESSSPVGAGVVGINSNSGPGVYGQSANGWAGKFEGSVQVTGSHRVDGRTFAYYGIEAAGQGPEASAIFAHNSTGYAGRFIGDVFINGTLSKGGGSFKIDHPLDPANKYLSHSFVESPDMMNLYNGNTIMDASGEATVVLPDWFEALNKDFRYQLTCIGGFAQVFVADEIANNRFRIAGGKPGLKVSWQVTGVRKDRWADAHRIVVEEEKPEKDRGRYLHPEVFGQPAEKGPVTEGRFNNLPK